MHTKLTHSLARALESLLQLIDIHFMCAFIWLLFTFRSSRSTARSPILTVSMSFHLPLDLMADRFMYMHTCIYHIQCTCTANASRVFYSRMMAMPWVSRLAHSSIEPNHPRPTDPSNHSCNLYLNVNTEMDWIGLDSVVVDNRNHNDGDINLNDAVAIFRCAWSWTQKKRETAPNRV